MSTTIETLTGKKNKPLWDLKLLKGLSTFLVSR